VPRFELPDGGALAFEPGGQLEYASPPARSPAALVADLRRFIPSVIRAGEEAGIALIGAGIDPFNATESVPLQIHAGRYRRMHDYFTRIGPAGARMMRQTASIQISVDPVGEPAATWRVLNALAPVLTAMFSNSEQYAGAPTGWASYRARTWQALDPARTGIFDGDGDVAGEYVEFALDAPVMLVHTAEGEYLPLRTWLARGPASAEFVDTHLSTLFPEVRPRRHFEVRSVDALPPAWLAVPVLLVSAIAMDACAHEAAAESLGDPDPDLLRRAAAAGLRDPTIARMACDIADIALAGGERLGPAVAGEDLDIACDFFDRYTRRGKSPAIESLATVATAA
jgi:glutamate--cysteine ligase